MSAEQNPSIGGVIAGIDSAVEDLNGAPTAEAVQAWDDLDINTVGQKLREVEVAVRAVGQVVQDTLLPQGIAIEVAGDSARAKIEHVTEGANASDPTPLRNAVSGVHKGGEEQVEAASGMGGKVEELLAHVATMNEILDELARSQSNGREASTKSANKKGQAIAFADELKGRL